MTRPEDVLKFWLDEVGPRGWYSGGDELDATIRTRFRDTWEKARGGELGLWLTHPGGSLAYIIVTDQFPRNMFRDDARAFSTDREARAAAKAAIDRGWDLRIDEPARQFFYMPLVHSECLVDQDRAVRLIHSRMPKTGADNLVHARVHRDIIRRFGRFPYRNAALARPDREGERAFIASGGYASTLETMSA